MPAEAGLGVRQDRREPVGVVVPFGGVDLVGAQERVVQPPDECRDAVRGIEALVGIGLAREVRLGSDLPAREVDRLEPGAHHLHRLAACDRPERGDGLVGGEELPEALGAEACERVLDREPAPEHDHVIRRVRPADALPARVVRPPKHELGGRGGLRGVGCHRLFTSFGHRLPPVGYKTARLRTITRKIRTNWILSGKSWIRSTLDGGMA